MLPFIFEANDPCNICPFPPDVLFSIKARLFGILWVCNMCVCVGGRETGTMCVCDLFFIWYEWPFLTAAQFWEARTRLLSERKQTLTGLNTFLLFLWTCGDSSSDRILLMLKGEVVKWIHSLSVTSRYFLLCERLKMNHFKRDSSSQNQENILLLLPYIALYIHLDRDWKAGRVLEVSVAKMSAISQN